MLPLWSNLVGIAKRVWDTVQFATVFGKLPGGDGFGPGRGRDGSLGKLNGATQEFGARVVVANQVFDSEHEPGHVAAPADVAERFEVAFHAGCQWQAVNGEDLGFFVGGRKRVFLHGVEF